MKTLKLIIFTLLISAATYLNAQDLQSTKDYDTTIDKLIPKAKKNKINDKQLTLLATSYHEANETDHKSIMKLKESGQADIWIEIYHRLTSIDRRQNKIKTLPDNIKTTMNFKTLNLENEINNSREKAELFIYAKTNFLLKNINEENLKEANWLVDELCKINPQSSKLEELKLRLAIMPCKHILFRVAAPTEQSFPDNITQLILNFDDNTIYGVPFDIIPNDDTKYDMMIRIMLEETIISPELTETVTYEEKKDNLVAKVNDNTISKSARILGHIEFIDVKKGEILITSPFDIGSFFKKSYTEVKGDMAACSTETLALINTEVVDFPSDESLIKDSAIKLNLIIKSRYQKKN